MKNQMPLKRNSAKPLYRQLDEIMREKVHSGEWKPHDAIPSENELAKLYGLSRMTARMVVMQLANEGILYRVQGKGTYVAEKKITARSLSYVGIREQMEQMGYQTTTRILQVVRTQVPEKISEKFLLSPGEPFYTVERLRLLDETPLSLHYSYIPADYCPGLEKHDLVGRQLCDILKVEYGLPRSHVVETLESIGASSFEADMLEVKKDFHLLMLKNFISTAQGKPFEYSKILFRGDRIKLKFEYQD